MPVTVEEAAKQPIRDSVCDSAETEILEILNRHELSMRELVKVLGAVMIDTGAALEGISDSVEETAAFTRYTANPTIGNAMISSGYDMWNWLKIAE